MFNLSNFEKKDSEVTASFHSADCCRILLQLPSEKLQYDAADRSFHLERDCDATDISMVALRLQRITINVVGRAEKFSAR